MNEYLKDILNSKSSFGDRRKSRQCPRALYLQGETGTIGRQAAKEVLVDVYDLLDFKKDAYELLCQLEIVPIKRHSSGWAR
jgi:hypothetical protein